MVVAKLKQYYSIIIVTILALVLRLFYLDRFGFWDGEIHTIFHSARPLSEFVVGLRDYAAHPPFWFFLTHFILEGEPTVWLLRFPSVIFGVLSVIAGYVLVKRYIGPKWALAAAWLLCIMPISLRWSQSARMYAAFLLFSTLSFIFTLDILQPARKFAWIGFSVVSILNLYTHYFAFFPLFVEFLFLLSVYFAPGISQWWEKKSARKRESQKDATQDATQNPGYVLRRLIFSIVTIFLGYGYWYWFVLRQNFIDRQLEREATKTQPDLDLEYVIRVSEDILGGVDRWFIWLIVGLIILGMVYLLSKKRKEDSIYLAIVMIAIPVLVVLVISPRRFHGRYFIFMLPYLSLFIVAGILAIKDQIKRLVRRQKLKEIFVFPAIGAILLLLTFQYLAIDRLYLLGDEDHFFETRTDPLNWNRRGLWVQWYEGIQGPSLMMSGNSAFVNKQAAVMAYTFQDFQYNMFGPDWGTVEEFDLWTVYPKFDGEITRELPTSACGVPFSEEFITGPNERFMKSHLVASSFQNLLENDEFELSATVLGNKKMFELVRSPSVEGDYALKMTNLPSRSSRKQTLSGELVIVEPSTILFASVSVLNPVLLYHTTAPELSLEFFDVNGEIISNKCPMLQSNLPYREFAPGEWQVLFLQTIVPKEARQVSIVLNVPGKIDSNTSMFIDDVNLDRIDWELP